MPFDASEYSAQGAFGGPAEPPRPLAEQATADYQIVSAEYFRALDLPLVEGRAFDARDTPSGVPVCIVNEAFVRAHLGGRPAIGARVLAIDATCP